MTSYELFRKNARLRMSELGWTQADLARELKCNPSYVSQLLSGNYRTGVTLTTVDHFAAALDMPAECLLTGR